MNHNPDKSYNYEVNGNRFSSHQHGNGYRTSENNGLLSNEGDNYEYDDKGNLIRRTEISSNQVTKYYWDYHHRLVEVSDQDPTGNLL